MTEAEIREYAQKIIIEACDYTGFWKVVEKLDTKVEMTLSSEGLYEFTFDFSQLFGTTAFVRYSPQGRIEGVMKEFQKIKKGDLKPGEEKFYEYVTDDSLQESAKLTMMLLPHLLKEVFYAIENFGVPLQSILSPYRLLAHTRKEIDEKIKEFTKSVNNTREHIISVIKGFYYKRITAPQYIFCEVYDELSLEWAEAKKFYKRNKKYKNSLEMVKLAFPDLEEDFVSDLADADNYTAQPSTIALKHAALLLNVPDSKRAERTLRRYLQESRKLRKQYSAKQVEEAIESYFKYIGEIDEKVIEMDKLL